MSELLAGADISGLPQRGKVVVGFSGGADSTALAHWLLGRLGPERLVLAHVNHQLRGEESDRDEAAARAFAKRFANLPLDPCTFLEDGGSGATAMAFYRRYRRVLRKLRGTRNLTL